MKNFGTMKKVEFSGKDIYNLRNLAKNNVISFEKWYYKELMGMVSFYGYDDNRSVEREEAFVKMILNEVNSENYAEAQKFINNHMESMWNSFTESKKNSLESMRKAV